MRATYKRTQGIEIFLGFYDVHADVLAGRLPHAQADPRGQRGLLPTAGLLPAPPAVSHVGLGFVRPPGGRLP